MPHNHSRRVPRLGALLHPRRLRQLLTHEFTVTEGSALLAAAFVVSALLGVVRQALLNAQFGVSMEASAYYAAFRLPDTIGLLVSGGTLANAMVPLLLLARRTHGDEATQRLTSLVLTALLCCFAPLTLLGIAFASPFVRYVLVPGFTAEAQQLTTTLTRIMLLEVLLVIANSTLTALLMSRNQWLLPAVAIMVRNITLIAGIGAAIRYPAIGIYGPTVGAIGDALLQLALLLPGLRHQGYRFRPVWRFNDSYLRQTVRLLIPNSLSALVNYAGTILDTAFASLAREALALATLQNALLLIGFPIRLLGVAIGQAAFPRLSAYAVAGAWDAMRRTLVWTIAISMVGSVAAALALIMISRPAIRLVYERGQFDALAGDVTYMLLVVYALGLPAYVVTEIVTRCLIALHDTRTPLATNCIQFAGRAAIIVLTIERLGVVSIPLAFAVSSVLEAALLSGVLWLKLRGKNTEGRVQSTDPVP